MADVAHLLRRATFGPRAEEVAAARAAGYPATVERLVTESGVDSAAAPEPDLGADPYSAAARAMMGMAKGDKPDKGSPEARAARAKIRDAARKQTDTATAWWVDRMVSVEHQYTEKLVWFWHGHWATSVQKVNSAALMLAQQHTLRAHATGDFRELARAMIVDPALMIWLDNQKNTKKAPNENLARETMELFTLGVGHYSENDIHAAAKALTGWRVNRATNKAVYAPKLHDDQQVTIFDRSGAFTAQSFVDICVTRPDSAKFVATRLWHRYAADAPDPDTLDRLVAAYGPGRNLTSLMRALFDDPKFGATTGSLVRQPVEWAVGAMRQLGLRPSTLNDKQRKGIMAGLRGMGQVPFRPPNVSGWPSGASWLTTSATQARLKLATGMAAAAMPRLKAISGQPAAKRMDALKELLVVDEWSDRTTAALKPALGTVPRLVALALVSPEYTVI